MGNLIRGAYIVRIAHRRPGHGAARTRFLRTALHGCFWRFRRKALRPKSSGGVSKRCARHFPRQLFGWQPRALRPRRAAEQRYQKLSGRLLTHLRPGPTIARTSDVLTIILRGSPGTSIEQYHTDMFLKRGMAQSDRDIYSGSSEPEAIRNVVWAHWSPAHTSSRMFSHELHQ